MLLDIEELSPTTRRLKIDVPSDVIQSETDSAYNNLRMTTRIPGFRAGKAPRAILEKRFGKNVEAQVIEKIVPQFYLKAVKEAKIEPVNYPDIDSKIEIKPGQPLSFSVTVEVKPVLEDLAYHDIVLKKRTFTVGKDEVNKAIELLREQKALYAVTDKELKDGDMAIVNSDAFHNDEPIGELSYKEYPLILGTGAMPQEFSTALRGKKNGDTVEVRISFDKGDPNKTIAGKEILFKVTIKEAKEKHLPPLDDAFAQESECENMDALREKMQDNLTKRKESQINLEYKREILDELVKRHEFAVPVSMLQGEIDSLIHQEKENAARRGEAMKPDEDLRKEFSSRATDNVKSVMLLEAIGKKEKIEVGDADVKDAIGEIAVRNNLKPEEVTKLYAVREGAMDALKSRLFADKVLEFILAKTTIED